MSSGLTWRALTLDDGADWATLMGAIEAVDRFGEHYTAEDFADEVSSPTMALAQDTFGVFDRDQMVAFGIVGTPTAPTDGLYSYDVWGGVRPSHRGQGIGRELLARMQVRGASVHHARHPDEPGRFLAHALDRTADRRRLLERAGYSLVRWFFDMERDLSEPVAPVEVPDDLALVGFDRSLDDDVRRAHNECFARHWGSVERIPEVWAQWFTGNRHFREDLSFLVVDGDEVVAYALCQRYPEEDEPHGYSSGWLGQLGTRAPWRGRGLGTALLRRILVAMQEDGIDRAALNVDSENATGARALYEREGFRTKTTRAAYAREI